jgi:hypothetical protein
MILEEVTEDRDLGQEGNARCGATGLPCVDSANHCGVAVPDSETRRCFFLLDGWRTVGGGLTEVGFVLRDVDVEPDVTIGGGVRLNFELEISVEELRIHTVCTDDGNRN